MNNPYERLPLDRVRADALHGVAAAREAYRRRDPVRADFDLGPAIDPAEQQQYRERVMAAIRDYGNRKAAKRCR